MKRIVILGAGESGAGAAVLAKKEGFDVFVSDMSKIAEKYQTAIKELGNPEKVLFLNDLRGGSPYNAACRLVKNNPKYGIVTGVNLPMLISMVYEDDADIKTLIEKAIFGGSEGMYPATYETLNAPEEILEGDE